MAGMDPIAFLAEEDEPTRALTAAIAHARMELEERRDHNLAVHIANNVGKLFGS